MVYLDAEFTRPKKSTRLIFRVGTIIPTSVKCIHSATKFKSSRALRPSVRAVGWFLKGSVTGIL